MLFNQCRHELDFKIVHKHIPPEISTVPWTFIKSCHEYRDQKEGGKIYRKFQGNVFKCLAMIRLLIFRSQNHDIKSCFAKDFSFLSMQFLCASERASIFMAGSFAIPLFLVHVVQSRKFAVAAVVQCSNVWSHSTWVWNSSTARVTIKALLVRKATRSHITKFTSLEQACRPVFGFRELWIEFPMQFYVCLQYIGMCETSKCTSSAWKRTGDSTA